MTGQIPPYGKHFRRESLPYNPHYGNRRYVLKTDADWWVRSDKTSKQWWVFHNHTPMGKPVRTLKEVMNRLLYGIEHGFYNANTEPNNGPRSLLPSRLHLPGRSVLP